MAAENENLPSATNVDNMRSTKGVNLKLWNFEPRADRGRTVCRRGEPRDASWVSHDGPGSLARTFYKGGLKVAPAYCKQLIYNGLYTYYRALYLSHTV